MLCIFQSLKPVNPDIFYNIRFTLTSEEGVSEEVGYGVNRFSFSFVNGCIICFIIIISSSVAILFFVFAFVFRRGVSFGLFCGLFSLQFGSPLGVASGVVVFEFSRVDGQGVEVLLQDGGVSQHLMGLLT